MSDEEEETSELLGHSGDTMEARSEHQLIKRFRLFHGISVVLGLILITLVLTWIINHRGGFSWSSSPATEFNWHPFLMVIGPIFLYAQSMLLYRSARNTRKRILKLCHAGLHFISFICAVVALKAVFDSHNLKNIRNMYSFHSWVGIITVIIFSCQFVVGFLSFLFPGFPTEIRRAYMHVHTNFGIVGFILALLAASMGLTEKAFINIAKYEQFGSETIMINFTGIILVAFGVLVLYLVNENTYKRVPLPEDEILLTSSLQQESAE